MSVLSRYETLPQMMPAAACCPGDHADNVVSPQAAHFGAFVLQRYSFLIPVFWQLQSMGGRHAVTIKTWDAACGQPGIVAGAAWWFSGCASRLAWRAPESCNQGHHFNPAIKNTGEGTAPPGGAAWFASSRCHGPQYRQYHTGCHSGAKQYRTEPHLCSIGC